VSGPRPTDGAGGSGCRFLATPGELLGRASGAEHVGIGRGGR
jgi:hypothetical protein